MKSLKYLFMLSAMLFCLIDSHAQDNGLNPVFTVNVNDLQYNVPEKKTTVGSVIGTIAQAAAGQTTDSDHKDMLPAVNAAVKSAISGVRRLQPADSSANANLELTGEVTQISTTQQIRTIEEKDSKGKTHKRTVNSFDATVGVSLTLRDLASNEVKTTSFTGNIGVFDDPLTEKDALNTCIRNMRNKIVKFYNSMFPLSANIIERGSEKKDKAKEMYIDIGSASGIDKGQKFTVYEIGSVAGRETRTKIGRLKVADIAGDDITLCKVSSGGKDIKKAFDAGKSLLVVSEE